MKRLLLILILTFSFQSLIKADDIRDFQIEGMSIGDSLLDYFSKKEIDNFIDPYKDIIPNRKVKTFLTKDNLKQYDILELSFFKNDNDYKLESIGGGIFFSNSFNNCINEIN